MLYYEKVYQLFLKNSHLSNGRLKAVKILYVIEHHVFLERKLKFWITLTQQIINSFFYISLLNNVTFDKINSMINFAVIIADPLRAVYIGSEPATPSKDNRKLSLHHHQYSISFLLFEWLQFSSNLSLHTTDTAALNCLP